MNTFLSVGSSNLCEKKFNEVSNNPRGIKPIGGLWLTEYDFDNPYRNSWVEYLTMNPHTLIYKYSKQNPIVCKSSVVKIKDAANFFVLSDFASFEYLKTFFPNINSFFDYEAMKDFFDGIFVDVNSLMQDPKISAAQKALLNTFSVSSLVLFNLKVIDYYQNALVTFELFDYEYNLDLIEYYIDVYPEIKYIDAKKRS